MTIRILCIVAALIAAVWISYKIELSRGWTAFFTLLVSAAMGFLATITPLNYEGYVTTAKSYETRVSLGILLREQNLGNAGDYCTCGNSRAYRIPARLLRFCV